MIKKPRDKFITGHKFYQAKNYQCTIFTGFEPNKISPMCQLIDYFIDNINLSFFEEKVKSNKVIGGRPALDNKILFKIYLYALYCDIPIRQLSKYNTIGSEFSFLSHEIHHFPSRCAFTRFLITLDNCIDNIFDQHIDFLKKEGIDVNTTYAYVDGTVLEAHNSRNKIITDTNVKRSDEKWKKVLKDANSSEQEKEIAMGKIETNKTKMEKMAKLKRYSYGRTDEDCVIMQDKNKSFIAGYNAQFIEEYKYGLVVYCHLSNKNPDSAAFLDIIDDFVSKYNPQFIIMDAGYGSPEIIAKLTKLGINPIVKSVKLENAKEKINEYSFELSNDEKTLTCPTGRIMDFVSIKDNKKKYKSRGCEKKSKCCAKAIKNKTIIIDVFEYRAMKQTSLTIGSKLGVEMYSHRGNICESPHGFIKHNLNGKKFTMNGLIRNNTMIKLFSILYNLRRTLSILKLMDNN